MKALSFAVLVAHLIFGQGGLFSSDVITDSKAARP